MKWDNWKLISISVAVDRKWCKALFIWYLSCSQSIDMAPIKKSIFWVPQMWTVDRWFKGMVVSILCLQFQVNETLGKLRLNGNKIKNKGGMAIAGALQVNTMLEELDLGETDQVMDIKIDLVGWVLLLMLHGNTQACSRKIIKNWLFIAP